MNLRKTVLTVATLNLIYFLVEFYFGRLYDSVALLSDSIDFLEDASINILIALAIGWSLRKRQTVTYLLALLLLVPGIAFLWNAFDQLFNPDIPVGEGMSVVGFGALIVNVLCAFLIARHRSEEGGLVMAAFFSARNDAIANLLIIIAGFVTVLSPSIWPDFIIGIAIFLMNADAAKVVIESTRKEGRAHRS
ncbi:MAG TPA: cation transporter [Candidatus Nanopelagicaceae bacterium]